MSENVEVDDFVTSDLEIMSHAHNYQAWMQSLCQRFLGAQVLEIGSGIGNMSKGILRNEKVERLTCVDPEEACIHACQATLEKEFDQERFTMLHGDYPHVSLDENTYDTAICFNVLEHLKEPEASIIETARVLKPGGDFVILVPAFECIRGNIDERLEHVHRYSKADLRKLMKQAGLDIEYMRYFNIVGFIGWFVNFRVLKRDAQSQKQVLFYDRVVFPIQEFFERITPWQPLGQSLLVHARKPDV